MLPTYAQTNLQTADYRINQTRRTVAQTRQLLHILLRRAEAEQHQPSIASYKAQLARIGPDDETPLPTDAPGGDCPEHGPYADNECPKE